VKSARLIEFATKRRVASTDWFDALLAFDDELSACRSGGETTAVVATIEHYRICGASVGDSVAWLISPAGELTDLTAHQRRKPLLGSGEALPVVFDANPCDGRLLASSLPMAARNFQPHSGT
jgi:PPM family protein phosphatase